MFNTPCRLKNVSQRKVSQKDIEVNEPVNVQV